jgi:hypothetical protein
MQYHGGAKPLADIPECVWVGNATGGNILSGRTAHSGWSDSEELPGGQYLRKQGKERPAMYSGDPCNEDSFVGKFPADRWRGSYVQWNSFRIRQEGIVEKRFNLTSLSVLYVKTSSIRRKNNGFACAVQSGPRRMIKPLR